MAHPTVALVRALRKTALRLREGSAYRWSHFAKCNCGNLAQTITDYSAREIYDAAFQRGGDWGEQAREYCATSGLPMDVILGEMYALGFEPEDVGYLERLSHPDVLRRVPAARRPLRHTSREDTVLFMETWATLLAEKLAPEERTRLEALDAEGAPVARRERSGVRAAPEALAAPEDEAAA